MNPSTLDPYCGPAPTPETLWTQWNFDPALLVVLAVSGFFLWRNAHSRLARNSALLAIVFSLIAFVSPLCALASALFSARVLHHVLLVACIAPLIVLALPKGPTWLDRVPGQLSFLVHAGLVWLWHAPAPYAFALSGDGAYWLMEATLLGSALWLWRDMLSPARPAGAALALALGTIVQMGMLGALLTFARAPLFDAHFATTQPFGLGPLEDQQLAGLIMWVPAALPYFAVSLLRLHRIFTSEPAGRNAAS